ncbi:MAG: NUDIX hydrolase [Clostridia bacterium]|nr:NUDIX hydrolase [Clostridia bacterium]
MTSYNAIAVFSADAKLLLMCERKKDPYKGLLNFVGGKIEEGETGSEAAYRELFEETGIDKDKIVLKPVMDLVYRCDGFYLEIYAGRLKEKVELKEEKNPLLWVDVEENRDLFFDSSRYAGDGNIGHIVRKILIHKKEYLDI